MTDARLLVVDDDRAVCESLAEYLIDLGYTVDTAGSGEEALNYAETHDYAVIIIIDLRLPGMSGEALAKQIHHRYPKTQFIIHTGSMEYEPTEEMKAVGISAEQIFPKPQLDISVFHRTIVDLLSRGSS